jgi:penicillin amidase
MAAAVTIVRDSWGVPHVSGPTDRSVVFGYMFAQAEDNFWQIEDSLIQALGRSAEVYGEERLGADLLNRALEIERFSRQEWDRTPAEIQALAEAAAAGLNYYIERHPDEVRLLDRVEPWNLLAFSRFSVYQLFMFGRAGIKASEMTSLAQPLDDESPGVEKVAVLSSDLFADLPGSPPDLQAADAWGSNMWAVSPQRSRSGGALLFINPHQPYFGPGQWIEGHVHSEEGLHFSGAGFPGSFLPTIGHNEFLGWSHTVNAPDVVDVYLETFDDPQDPDAYRYGEGHRSATRWTTTLQVLGEDGELASRSFELRRTHRGPVVGERDGKALVVKMAKFEEGGQLEQRYRMARARNLDEFKAAMGTLATPMFNTVYADVEGNIWYAYYGAVPRRDPSYDWSAPVDGSDPGTEWQGYHPLEELPQVLNPPAGYVQNCNATPFLATAEGGNPDPSDFPPYMVSEDDNPRSRISRRILEGQDDFSFEEFAALAFDTRVIEAEVWIPRLADALASSTDRQLQEALALLTGWDGVSTVDSEAMTLFFAWREIMIQQRNEDLVDSFAKAVNSLNSTWGTWRVAWGELNRLQRRHTSGTEAFSDAAESLAVAGGPGPLGIVFNFYTRPEAGAKRRYGVAGHSFVKVVDFAPEIAARSILVFGQRHDPSSPHYFDQSRLFAERKFKESWFSPQAVAADAVATYQPGGRVELQTN